MALNQPGGPAGPQGVAPRGIWSSGVTANKGELWRRVNGVYLCGANGTTTDPLVDGVNWSLFLQDGASAATAKSLLKLGGNRGSTAAAGALVITVPAGGHQVGNLLVIPVMVGYSGATGTAPAAITGVIDNHASTTNVYTIEAASAAGVIGSGQTRIQFVWCILTTGLSAGDSITVTLSPATSIDLVADSAEFVGVTARDVVAEGSITAASTSPAAGSLQPIVPGELCVAAFGSLPTSWGAGFNGINSFTEAGTVTRAFTWGYSVLPTAAAVNPSINIASSAATPATAMLFR